MTRTPQTVHRRVRESLSWQRREARVNLQPQTALTCNAANAVGIRRDNGDDNPGLRGDTSALKCETLAGGRCEQDRRLREDRCRDLDCLRDGGGSDGGLSQTHSRRLGSI